MFWNFDITYDGALKLFRNMRGETSNVLLRLDDALDQVFKRTLLVSGQVGMGRDEGNLLVNVLCVNRRVGVIGITKLAGDVEVVIAAADGAQAWLGQGTAYEQSEQHVGTHDYGVAIERMFECTPSASLSLLC